MELKIFDSTYSTTTEFMNYVEIRYAYNVMARQLVEDFSAEFNSSCTTADLAIDKGNDIAGKYIAKATVMSLDYLAQHKIYTVDKDIFLTEVREKGILDFWADEFRDIKEEYDDIVGMANDEINYREIRKESRGRFVGGGFGIEGALKGAAQAGAMNLATGMVHSLFNSIGNSFTMADMRKKKNRLYESISARLCESLYETIRNYCWVTMDFMEKEEVMRFCFPSNDELKKANALFNNIEVGRVPEDEIRNVVVQILKINPLNEDFYYWMLCEFGDANCEIEQFASNFKIDLKSDKISLVIQPLYEEMSKIYASHAYDLDMADLEAKLISLRDKIPESKQNLGVVGRLPFEDELDKEIENIAEEYKTVDGVRFKTTAEAANAKEDLALLEKYVSVHGVNPDTIKDELSKLKFKTSIVTDRIDEYVANLISDSDANKLSAKVQNVFDEECFFDSEFSTESMDMPIDKKLFSKTLFIEGISDDYKTVFDSANKLCVMNPEEIIAFIIRSNAIWGKKQHWFIVSNCCIYSFESKENQTSNLVKIPLVEISDIQVDKYFGITIIKNNGSTDGFIPEFEGVARYNDTVRFEVADRLTNALRKIIGLLRPLTQGRNIGDAKSFMSTNLSDIVRPLDIKSYVDFFNSIIAKTNSPEKLKKTVLFNDGSQDFKMMLSEHAKFWQTQFINETPYFIISNYNLAHNLYESFVFTSKYVYFIKDFRENSAIYPVEKVGEITIKRGKLIDTYFICFDGKDEELNLVSVPLDVREEVAKFVNIIICGMNKDVFLETDLSNKLDKAQSISDIEAFLKGLESESADNEVVEKYKVLATEKKEKMKQEEIERKEIEARTFRGILFDSIEQKNQAESDSEKIETLIGGDIKDIGILKLKEILVEIQEQELVEKLKADYVAKISKEIVNKETKIEKDKAERLGALNLRELDKFDKGVSEYIEWAKQNGVETNSIVDRINKLRDVIEDNLLHADGEIYGSIQEAEKARVFLVDFSDRLYNTSLSDVDGLNTLLKEIRESIVLSKDKYIEVIENKLDDADKLYRTVRNVEYSTREEADIARAESKRVKQEISLEKISAWEEIDRYDLIVQTLQTNEIKQAYTRYLDIIKSVCNAQKEMINRNYEYVDLSSTGCYTVLADALFVGMQAENIGMIVPEFEDWFSSIEARYLTINGYLCQDVYSAYDSFLAAVEHAKLYLQYITDKNSTAKKGFFAKVKSGVTGIMYAGYEGEYNFVTANGTREIPTNLIAEKNALVQIAGKMNSEMESFIQLVDSAKKAIDVEDTQQVGNVKYSGYIHHRELSKKQAAEILGINV